MKHVKFEDLKVGDIINYDMLTRDNNIINSCLCVLQINDTQIKLHKPNFTMYCSKEHFKQFKNVTIIN